MLNIIVAPREYSQVAESYTKKIAKYLKSIKADYSVYFSLDIDNLVDNVKQLLSMGETDFVVVGDDRIISIFVNAVKDLSKIKLGIVPTSKYDDFASYLRLNHDPVDAMKDILKLETKNIDLLLVNDKKVINNVAIGASVDIYEAYDKYTLKNIVTLEYAELKYGKMHKSETLSIAFKNSKPKSEDVYELVVANGGNSRHKPLSPLSNVSDGLFNLLYIKDVNKDNAHQNIRSLFKGKHIYKDKTSQFWNSEVTITNDNNNIKVMVDGLIYSVDKLEIKVLEGALRIFKSGN